MEMSSLNETRCKVQLREYALLIECRQNVNRKCHLSSLSFNYSSDSFCKFFLDVGGKKKDSTKITNDAEKQLTGQRWIFIYYLYYYSNIDLIYYFHSTILYPF